MGCGQLTAVCLSEFTAIHLSTYYKLTGRRFGSLTFSRDAARKKNVLAVWEASLQRGGSCGVREWAVESLPSSASQRSPLSASQGSPSSAAHIHVGTVLMLRPVQFANGLLGHQTNGLFGNWLIYSSYRTNCHVCALFVNSIDQLPTVMFMTGKSYYHTSFANKECLALLILQVTRVCACPLTSGYPGQAEPCPPSAHSLTCYV